jgi:hypothetical protein
MVKECSLEDTITYLNKIGAGIKDLYLWTLDGSKEQYVKIMKEFSELEQSIITRICEVKYCIDLSSLKNLDLSIPSPENKAISPYHETYEESGISASLDAESNNTEELFQLASEMDNEEPNELEQANTFVESKCVNPDDNSKYFSEYQKFQINSPEYVPVFEIMLNEIRLQQNLSSQTPESTYIYLRQHDWNAAIPRTFFFGIFRLYMIDLVHKNKPANFPEVIRKEVQKLKDACELLFEFPSNFLTPELIESLENDNEILPYLAHHNTATLPVISKKNNSKTEGNNQPEKKESVESSPKIIDSILPLTPSLTTKKKSINKNEPLFPVIPIIRSDVFKVKLESNLKALEKIPKNAQISFFSAKLQKIKNLILQ